MAKTDIVEKIAEIAKINKAEAGRALDGLVAYITQQLKAGEKIKIAGMGTFVVKDRAARKARNPKTGVEVIESRVSHLAYAPEIAGVMLQRQQASAMIAARTKIVEGAVGMVDMALTMIEARGMAKLDGERRAAMISNLLVVLCGEKNAQPVLNTGTIYQ